MPNSLDRSSGQPTREVFEFQSIPKIRFASPSPPKKWLWLKRPVPNWHPGKWSQRLKPRGLPQLFTLEPHPSAAVPVPVAFPPLARSADSPAPIPRRGDVHGHLHRGQVERGVGGGERNPSVDRSAEFSIFLSLPKPSSWRFQCQERPGIP